MSKLTREYIKSIDLNADGSADELIQWFEQVRDMVRVIEHEVDVLDNDPQRLDMPVAASIVLWRARARAYGELAHYAYSTHKIYILGDHPKIEKIKLVKSEIHNLVNAVVDKANMVKGYFD